MCQMVKSGMTAQGIGYEHSCNNGCGIKAGPEFTGNLQRRPQIIPYDSYDSYDSKQLASNPLVY